MATGLARLLFVSGTLALACGCIPIPRNTQFPPPPRILVFDEPDLRVSVEEGVADAVWLEVPRSDGTGFVGGYLAQNEISNGGLVILLHGASTLTITGGAGSALRFHNIHSPHLRQAGFATWSLAVRECGSGYGQNDLADLLSAIDWLQGPGRNILGVDRVYLVGYSTGAIMTLLANRERTVTASVSIGGVTHPEQFARSWDFFRLVSNMFPENIGMCQLGNTLDHYGPPGDPRWEMFNTVEKIRELRGPILVIQGTHDQIFSIDNLYRLQARYEELVAAGEPLQEMAFFVMEGGDHFRPSDSPEIQAVFREFLLRFEPVAASVE